MATDTLKDSQLNTSPAEMGLQQYIILLKQFLPAGDLCTDLCRKVLACVFRCLKPLDGLLNSLCHMSCTIDSSAWSLKLRILTHCSAPEIKIPMGHTKRQETIYAFYTLIFSKIVVAAQKKTVLSVKMSHNIYPFKMISK